MSETTRVELETFIVNLPQGPFKSPCRYQLTAMDGKTENPLHGLGTYGVIKQPSGFIIGATVDGEKNLEDFGYQMELLILKAADLGLGTCWLGGSFTRSTFSKRMAVRKDEILPAVVSIGRPDLEKTREQIDMSRKRFDPEKLFFSGNFTHPLTYSEVGDFAFPLEMVRLAPSAKNYQPWRVVKAGNNWHFYLQRTRSYREMVVPAITGIADLQRLDMGIAMSHFELAAREAGLTGRWQVEDPGIEKTGKLMEYSVSWVQ
ncbi:nitroreductase family [Leptolinea tardivitalis]|nr:nitroreductase family [Leptolinea tardivitalis]